MTIIRFDSDKNTMFINKNNKILNLIRQRVGNGTIYTYGGII